MKKIVRLTESDLARIVKKVIEEQAVSSAINSGLSLVANPAEKDKEWVAIKDYLKSNGFKEGKGKISNAYYTPPNATYLYKNFGDWGVMKVQYPFYDDTKSTNLNRIQITLGRHYLTKYQDLFGIPENCIARDKMAYSRIGIYKFPACKSSLEKAINYITSHTPPPREPRRYGH